MTRSRRIALTAGIGSAVAAALIAAFIWTAPTRGSMRALVALMNAANRGSIDEAREYCSIRYLAEHPLELAPEGGVKGLPRGIHKNFQAWRSGPNVWICITNRQGPVYQFVRESGGWKYDGLIGLLRQGEGVIPLTDSTIAGEVE